MFIGITRIFLAQFAVCNCASWIVILPSERSISSPPPKNSSELHESSRSSHGWVGPDPWTAQPLIWSHFVIWELYSRIIFECWTVVTVIVQETHFCVCLKCSNGILILKVVLCNIVGYVIYVVISLPATWRNSFVLGTFCLYDFMARNHFSAEQSYIWLLPPMRDCAVAVTSIRAYIDTCWLLSASWSVYSACRQCPILTTAATIDWAQPLALVVCRRIRTDRRMDINHNDIS